MLRLLCYGFDDNKQLIEKTNKCIECARVVFNIIKVQKYQIQEYPYISDNMETSKTDKRSSKNYEKFAKTTWKWYEKAATTFLILQPFLVVETKSAVRYYSHQPPFWWSKYVSGG